MSHRKSPSNSPTWHIASVADAEDTGHALFDAAGGDGGVSAECVHVGDVVGPEVLAGARGDELDKDVDRVALAGAGSGQDVCRPG